MSDPTDTIALDPRQQKAAALLLLAFDLPAPAAAAAAQIALAAQVCPDLKLSDVPPLGEGSSRFECLYQAVKLIGPMLDEIEPAWREVMFNG